MARFRVLIPRDVVAAVLDLPLWERARAALRLLADDPRPNWASPCHAGRVFFLDDRSWVLYAVDEERQLVTVVGAGR